MLINIEAFKYPILKLQTLLCNYKRHKVLPATVTSALVESLAQRAPVLFSSRSYQPISCDNIEVNISRLTRSTSRAPDREKVKPCTTWVINSWVIISWISTIVCII